MPNLNGLYELVNLSADEVRKAVDAIGGSCVWAVNHCYPTQRAIARPRGCTCPHCIGEVKP